MVYSDAARVTENTKRITTTGSVQANTRAAVNTFGDTMEPIFTTYFGGATGGLKFRQAFRDKLVDLCRYLDTEMDK